MYTITPALYFFSLFAVLGVVRADSGLYFPGVTLTLLVFHDKVFEADASFRKIKKVLSFRRRSGSERDGGHGHDGTPERPDKRLIITPEVKKFLKSTLYAPMARACMDAGSPTLLEQLRKYRVPGNSKGEKNVMKVLTWRRPAPLGSSPLDGVLEEGIQTKFISASDSTEAKVVRTARLDNSDVFMNIQHAEYGAMTLSAVTLTLSEAIDPFKANEFFSRLHGAFYLPPPMSGQTPLEDQLMFGLYLPLDILRLPGKYLLKEQKVPGRVIYNLFPLYTRMECRLDELLEILSEQGKDSPRRGAARHARLSITVQIIDVLGRLREEQLVPPPVNAASFVVGSNGDVLLAGFAPLLKEDESYYKRSDGVIVVETKARKKQGFVSLEDGVPYDVDPKGTDEDLAALLVEVWCPELSRAAAASKAAAAAAVAAESSFSILPETTGSGDPSAGSPSSEEEKLSAAEGGAPPSTSSAASSMASRSRGQKGGELADTVDWSKCEKVPEEVIRLHDALTSGAVSLARLPSLFDYTELVRYATARSSTHTE